MSTPGSPTPALLRARRILTHSFVLPKPFAGARWLIWPLAATSALALFLGVIALNSLRDTYRAYTGTLLFCTVMLTCTTLACFWEAHAYTLKHGVAGHSPWRGLRNLLSLGLWTLSFTLVLIVISPVHETYTDRAHVSEIILAASAAKTDVTVHARAGVPLDKIGEGVSIELAGLVSASAVSPNGVIMVASTAPAAIVVMTPTLKMPSSGDPRDSPDLSWTCTGSPSRLMPASCR
jgi:type IV pilus assembly protein PilA